MIMAEPTMEVIMERFDAHAARWRLACHRQAAVRLVDGQTPRRVARHLHEAMNMPHEVRTVVERVRVELQLRAGL